MLMTGMKTQKTAKRQASDELLEMHPRLVAGVESDLEAAAPPGVVEVSATRCSEPGP